MRSGASRRVRFLAGDARRGRLVVTAVARGEVLSDGRDVCQASPQSSATLASSRGARRPCSRRIFLHLENHRRRRPAAVLEAHLHLALELSVDRMACTYCHDARSAIEAHDTARPSEAGLEWQRLTVRVARLEGAIADRTLCRCVEHGETERTPGEEITMWSARC